MDDDNQPIDAYFEGDFTNWFSIIGANRNIVSITSLQKLYNWTTHSILPMLIAHIDIWNS